jgi:predicted ribosome quality control (RQC) complex YloA/Tae2 family protein
MPLTADEIRALVEECKPSVEGARVEDVHQISAHTAVVTLYSGRAGKMFLLLSTRPELARFHMIKERPRALPSPPPFTEAARRLLKGRILSTIRQLSGDRIVRWTFSETPQAKELQLILELRGDRGQLLVLGPERRLLASLEPLRRGGREILPGDTVRFPRAEPSQGAVKAMALQPWRYLGAPPAADGIEEPFPLHFAFAARYEALEREADLLGATAALVQSLRREIARREKTVEKVKGDLDKARKAEEHRKSGELLKGALHSIRRGMSSIELPDYYDPELGQVRVDLQPSLSPLENVERYFKLYQKCRRALPFITERLARLEGELALARELVEAAAAAGTLESIAELESRAREILRPRAVRRKGPAAAGPPGPRRFLSADGYEILVGRNARGNDELTRKMAHGNDTFLHVSGRPGAHVIVRALPGKTVPLETLLDAAHLALYYSFSPKARSGSGTTRFAGAPAAEVHYAPAKHVRKPKGLKPGMVLLATHKTLRVRLEADRIERLKSTGGEGPSVEN